MKSILKLLALILPVVILSIYFNGCSTAEQTTGKIAFAQGDFEKAEMEFSKETTQNPQNEEAWFYLGLSRLQLNKLDAADQALKEYRKIGKNTFNSELIDAWGKKFDEGYLSFKNASATTDTSVSMKLYANAINSFKQAVILQPDSTDAKKNIDIINGKINTILLKPLLDKGVAFEGTGDYASAIEQYKLGLPKVEKGSANYEIVIYDLGVAYLKWGEKIRDENKDKNPDDKSFQEQYKLALPYLEELSKSTSKDNQLLAYRLLVQVYGNLGMNTEAENVLKIQKELEANK